MHILSRVNLRIPLTPIPAAHMVVSRNVLPAIQEAQHCCVFLFNKIFALKHKKIN